MTDNIADVTSNGGWKHTVGQGSNKTYKLRAQDPQPTNMKVNWVISAESVEIFLNGKSQGTFGVGVGQSSSGTSSTGITSVKVKGKANGSTYSLSLLPG